MTEKTLEESVERVEESLSCFSEGFNCAQSVLAVYAPSFGIDRQAGLRIAGAFGGGMAGTGETCGAVTGALMVIGLRFAATDAGDAAAKEKTREAARRFLRQFVSTFGSSRCKDLLNCDLGTAEGMEKAREQGLFKTMCPRFVEGASRILDTCR
jgi:C_GCAxxG_C_C family probable redox protein